MDLITRPAAIGRFEQLWIASTIAWLGGTWLAWARTQSSLLANPQSAPVAGWFQPMVVAVVLLVTLLLWWLVARKRSMAAAYLIAALAVVGALRAAWRLLTLASGRTLHPLSDGLFLIAAVLSVLAAVALFRPESRAWLDQQSDDDLPENAA